MNKFWNPRWKMTGSSLLCTICDLYLVYHKRTNMFYCAGCDTRIQLIKPQDWNGEGLKLAQKHAPNG